MYEVKFKDDNKYTGEYGPVMFINGVAKVKDDWIATWFEGRGFDVAKIEEETPNNIDTLTVDQLKDLAKKNSIEGYSKMKREELIEALKGGE